MSYFVATIILSIGIAINVYLGVSRVTQDNTEAAAANFAFAAFLLPITIVYAAIAARKLVK